MNRSDLRFQQNKSFYKSISTVFPFCQLKVSSVNNLYCLWRVQPLLPSTSLNQFMKHLLGPKLSSDASLNFIAWAFEGSGGVTSFGRWKKESEVAQSCLTLCHPMDCSLPGFSVHGIFQARVLEWVGISFSRGSSQPRDWTWVSYVSCIAGGFFTTSTTIIGAG